MADLGPVPVGDLEIADRIAKAVRRGRAADRHPTLDQLLAAFDEREPTIEARRRVARALALAGVATAPDLLEAAPGQRVTLEVRRPRKRHVLLVGIAALVVSWARSRRSRAHSTRRVRRRVRTSRPGRRRRRARPRRRRPPPKARQRNRRPRRRSSLRRLRSVRQRGGRARSASASARPQRELARAGE